MKNSRGNFNLAHTLLAAVCLLALTSGATAQSTATLQGAVTDQSGAVVPAARVVARSLATGTERNAQTDSEGNYQIAAMPVGGYRIEVQAQGFQTQVVNTLNLGVAQTVVQNFQLTVGNIAQEVTVTSGAPVVETTTTSVGTVINERTVQEIPLNGRHFVDLGLLLPGSVTPPQNGFLTAPLRGQGSFAFNTAGNREDTVNFQINGVNLNDMVQNQITFQPSINTVQEFKADNSTFSAEYGRNSGAVVNIATRSGTNEFHGELFEFFRNEALDARNFFDARKPPFKRNQFGAAIGGPLLLPHFGEGGPAIVNGKNKTFFFFSYEGLRQRQGLSLNNGVLTDAQRAAVIDPIARRLLDFIPTANVIRTVGGAAQGFFVGAATAPVNIDQWTIDINHNLTSDDRLHGYYAFQRDQRGEPTLQLNTHPRLRRHAPIASPDFHAQRNAHVQSQPRQRSALRLQPHQHHVYAQRALEPGRLRHQQWRQPTHRHPADHSRRPRPQLRRPHRLPARTLRHDLRLLRYAQLFSRQPLAQVRRRVPPLLQQQLQPRHGHVRLRQRRRVPTRHRQRLQRHASATAPAASAQAHSARSCRTTTRRART